MPDQSNNEPKPGLTLRPLRTILLTALGAGLLVAAYLLADKSGALLRAGFSQDDVDAGFSFLLGMATGLLFVMAVFSIWKTRYGCSADSLRRHIDEHHRRWRLLTVAMLCIALNGTLWASEGAAALRPAGMIRMAAHVFLIFMLALVVSFGPGFLRKVYRQSLNDELTLALRARALRLGYLTAVIVLGGSFLSTVYAPAATAAVMSWGLFTCIAVPALYFVLLDWRAGAE